MAWATRSTGPGVDVPDAGAVTWKVAVAAAPGATVPTESVPLGVTVQPDGTLRSIAAPRSGDSLGLVSVALTVNPCPGLTSALELVTPSVGLGAVGRP